MRWPWRRSAAEPTVDVIDEARTAAGKSEADDYYVLTVVENGEPVTDLLRELHFYWNDNGTFRAGQYVVAIGGDLRRTMTIGPGEELAR